MKLGEHISVISIAINLILCFFILWNFAYKEGVNVGIQQQTVAMQAQIDQMIQSGQIIIPQNETIK